MQELRVTQASLFKLVPAREASSTTIFGYLGKTATDISKDAPSERTTTRLLQHVVVMNAAGRRGMAETQERYQIDYDCYASWEPLIQAGDKVCNDCP